MVFNTRTENSKDVWETPQYFFELLDKEFHFDIDVAASDNNTKCSEYITEAQDGLKQQWNLYSDLQPTKVFCNPPYKDIDKWIEKGFREGLILFNIVVMLIPVRSDTQYWHEYIMKAKEVRLCKGRINFEINGKSQGSPNFASCVVVFDGEHEAKFSTMYHKEKDLIKYKSMEEWIK